MGKQEGRVFVDVIKNLRSEDCSVFSRWALTVLTGVLIRERQRIFYKNTQRRM